MAKFESEQKVPDALRNADGTASKQVDSARGAFIGQTNEDASVHVSSVHKLANRGSLDKLLDIMTFSQKANAMKQLSSSLSNAHQKNTVFLDIKELNVLVHARKKPKAGQEKVVFKHADLDEGINLNDRNDVLNKELVYTTIYTRKDDIDNIHALRTKAKQMEKEGKNIDAEVEQIRTALKQIDIYEQGVTFLSMLLPNSDLHDSQEYFRDSNKKINTDPAAIKKVKEENKSKAPKDQIQIKTHYSIAESKVDSSLNELLVTDLTMGRKDRQILKNIIDFAKTMVDKDPSKRPSAEGVDQFLSKQQL